MIEIVHQKPLCRRPRILVEAARICAKGYCRETMFPKFIGADQALVIDLLKKREEKLEEDRRAQEATYTAREHIEALSALMAESKKAA